MSHKTFDDPHGTSDMARQGLLDNRSEHKSKRHGTLKRRKRLSKAKRQRIKAYLERRDAAVRKYKAAVRSYWRGESDHPTGTGSVT